MPEKSTGPIEAQLLPLKAESLQCIKRFMTYEPPRDVRPLPRRRQAAVAVVLFIGRLGDLYVLLSTRAGTMRSYASDTALPGGKCEDTDADIEATARREAYEEIGLPIDRSNVRRLCDLPRFMAGNGLIVTPVVFLGISNEFWPTLNPDEVSSLFSMPLMAFLQIHPSRIPGWHFGISSRLGPVPTYPVPPPQPAYVQGAGEVGGRDGRYYQWRDVDWGAGKVRMHRFLTGREGGGIRPVYGLTANILILAASTGYDQVPAFDMSAPNQRGMEDRIEWEIKHRNGPLRRAVEAENLLDIWNARSPPTAKL